MKTFVFDIDGTICNNTYGKYELAEPYLDRINFINDLFKKGNTIKYFTARGSTTGIDWYDLTKKQLNKWGALHHLLILNKPEGDIYIDDKGQNSEDWLFPSIEVGKGMNEKQDYDSFKTSIHNHINILNKVLLDEKICNQINEICNKAINCLNNKGKIIFAGNGGIFSDSQHLATEFVCKFNKDRQPLPAVVLGTNSSNLTAIGNDYGFHHIFSRELEAIGRQGDLLLALTTSGRSQNIINLIKKAESLKIPFFVLSGESGGKLAEYNDLVVKVPSNQTDIIQQIHILLGHLICKNVEVPYL